MVFRLILVLLLSYGGSLWGQTQFLMMPSGEDLKALSHLFEETGKPFPVHIIYDSSEKEVLAMGIALSDRVRNGIHARLVVSAGLAKNLLEAKSGARQFEAGTLFLERQNGEAVLSVHGRNSYRSTLNSTPTRITVKRVIPRSILMTIFKKTSIPIVNSSYKLNEVIDRGNRERYLDPEPPERHQHLIFYHSLDDSDEIREIRRVPIIMRLFSRSEPALESHPKLVEEIILNRLKSFEAKSCRSLMSAISTGR